MRQTKLSFGAKPAPSPPEVSGGAALPSDAAPALEKRHREESGGRTVVQVDEERVDEVGAPAKRAKLNEDLSAQPTEISPPPRHDSTDADADAAAPQQRGELNGAPAPAPSAVAPAAAGKSIPTSMAKLFQDDSSVFDVYGSRAKLWPKPAKEGQADVVPYAALADTLADVSSTGSRLECVKLLALYFLAVLQRCPEDILPSTYLSMNGLAPAYEGVELGIGDAVLMKVVAEICGLTDARLKEEYRKTGDLAEVAQSKKQRQCTLVKPKPLLVRRVYNTFKEIALMSGKDVMRRRSDAIKVLLRDSIGPETNLIVRALQQKMRIGLAEPSILVALGYAFALRHMGADTLYGSSLEEVQVKLNAAADGLARIYHEVPSLDIVVPALLQHGVDILDPATAAAQQYGRALSIRPGLPVKPQLAHPTSGITIILDRFQDKAFTCEYKYDGERAQIHYNSEKGFEIFSRNSEWHTEKYVDVIAALPSVFSAETVKSFILDSEIVAVDPNSGALQAFQVLQHRSRKNVDINSVTIPVCVFAFDLLYLNGEPLLHRTLRERRAVMWKTFTAKKPILQFADHLESTESEDIQRFLDASIADGCEGLMVKTLDEEATYTPAKRSRFWLKLKKDYMDGVTDTADLVPIGAYYGKGKRTGVYGGFLLACYDEDNDEYQSICKLGTGFQDDLLESVTQALQPHAVDEKPRYYRSNETPDVWLTETQVWEIKAADLSISPVHLAAYGLVDKTRGIALRFPRFVRVRDDKKPSEGTNAAQIADMYRQQSLATRQNAGDDDDDDGNDVGGNG